MSEHWESRAPRAPDCGRRNRDGVPCYLAASHPPTMRHLGIEAGGGAVSWGEGEPEGLPPDEAARRLLSSPAELLELCEGDAAAVRGARVVLGMVARGELGSYGGVCGCVAPVASPIQWIASGLLDLPPAVLARALWGAVGEDGERAREVGAGLRAVVSELMALAGGGGR